MPKGLLSRDHGVEEAPPEGRCPNCGEADTGDDNSTCSWACADALREQFAESTAELRAVLTDLQARLVAHACRCGPLDEELRGRVAAALASSDAHADRDRSLGVGRW